MGVVREPRELPPHLRIKPELALQLGGEMMELQARVQAVLAEAEKGDVGRTPYEIALLLQLSDRMDAVVDYYVRYM